MTDFSTLLLNWYKEHNRALPWRLTNDPYKIWISEIILQQTQVIQGTKYYHRFIERFPNVQTLASASEVDVLKAWQGLGYYSRARNLHFTAQLIIEKHNGHFPQTYNEIIALKGIGPYTAAAITSFAFNLPHAVVDGNVYRFLARYFGISTPINSTEGKKLFEAKANEILTTTHPNLHNQAMMEIGALVCKPSSPLCTECPFTASCIALSTNTIKDLPVKTNRTKQRDRNFHYFLITQNGMAFIQQRQNKDIWKGLYELPLIETPKISSTKNLMVEIKEKWNLPIPNLKCSYKVKHVLSHQIIHTKFFCIEGDVSKPQAWTKIPLKELANYPFPQLIVNFLKEIGISSSH